MTAADVHPCMWITTLLALAAIIPVGTFRSVEVHHGGRVIVRHGAVQRVSMIKGDRQFTRIRIVDGDRLVIDRTDGKCPRDYEVEIEVVTPHVERVVASNGAWLQAVGHFPAQASIEVDLEQGGTIDIRAIAADNVEASVFSGGRILTTARETLDASVDSGGVITYWGEARSVKKSVHDGGMVRRGQ